MMKNKNTKPIYIPGLGDIPKDYRTLLKHVTPISVDWNNIEKVKMPKTDILIGFSMGGILACVHTLKHKVKTLILCSLTPGLETLEKVKADRVLFLVGQKEKWCTKETKRIAKTLKCKWSIIIIPKGNHKITGKYREELLKILEKTEK